MRRFLKAAPQWMNRCLPANRLRWRVNQAGGFWPGDSVVVLPGERFRVDATILEGRTTVDESLLTGESTPLAREPGGRVLARRQRCSASRREVSRGCDDS